MIRVLALFLSMCIVAARGDDKTKTTPAPAAKTTPAKITPPVKPPTEAQLRTTITKSLAFLAKEGDEWMAAKSCNGCHHLPVLLWSHREAKRHGFPVDQEKFDEWLFWANESAAGKSAGGVEVFAYLILAVPEHPAAVLTKRIADEQKLAATATTPTSPASGMMQGTSAPDAVDTANLRTLLLALASPPASQPETDATRAKAAAELKKMGAANRLDALLYRTLYARRFGKPEDATALGTQILKLQRGDGGWSEVIGANQSDPLATGQALYALQSSPDPKAADAIARAQLWLVGLQRDNGSWPIDYAHISKTDRSAPDKAGSVKNVTGIYTFWGSAWATIGLLQALPTADVALAK